jgi:archaellum component FlaC
METQNTVYIPEEDKEMLDPMIDDLPPTSPYEELKKKVTDQGWEIERLKVEIKRLQEVITMVRDTYR